MDQMSEFSCFQLKGVFFFKCPCTQFAEYSCWELAAEWKPVVRPFGRSWFVVDRRKNTGRPPKERGTCSITGHFSSEAISS